MYDEDWLDGQILADLLEVDWWELDHTIGGYVTADEAVEIVLTFGEEWED